LLNCRAATIIATLRPRTIILIVAHLSARLSRYSSGCRASMAPNRDHDGLLLFPEMP
jgi:hypothetical protein